MTFLPKTLVFSFSFFLFGLPPAIALDLSGTVFEKVGNEKNLDPTILYAIALAESAYSPSGLDKMVSPYPWTLRTKSTPFYGRSKEEAQLKLRELLHETDSVDVGLMQINVKWHKHRVDDVVKLLDPETNLSIGADILNENLKRFSNDLIAALGCFHSCEQERRSKYGLTVWNIFNKIQSEPTKSYDSDPLTESDAR